jgi:carboxymethylenebutenolidase
MRQLFFLLMTLSISSATMAQSSQSVAPQTVDISSGGLRLKAFLWKPAGPGPFPAVAFNHGRSETPQQHTRTLTITAAAQVLGPVFVKHGYIFLYLSGVGKAFPQTKGHS